MGSIYGLSYDYVQQNGNFLIIDKHDGLYNQHLVELQVKMLQTNPIPRLLSIEIEEMDLEVKLRFNITGKRMLSHFLIGKKLSQKELFQLLLKVTSVLDDSKNYMLSENNYLLHEDFIFIGQDLNDLYLTYVPLKTLPHKDSVANDIRTLTMSLISNVEELTGSAFQELMNYLKGDNRSLAGIKQLLIKINNELLTGKQHQHQQHHYQQQQQHHHQQAVRPNDFFSYEEKIPQVDQPIKPVNFHEPEPKTVQQNDFVPPPEFFREPFETVEEVVEIPIQPLAKKVKIYIVIFAILGLFIMWKSYLDFQSEGMLYISIGVSLMILNLVNICMNQLWKKPETKVVKQQSKAPEVNRVFAHNHVGVLANDATVKANNHVVRERETVKQPNHQSSQTNVKSYYDQLQNQTVILHQAGHDQTVLISGKPSTKQAIVNPYLEVVRNGGIQKVEISKDSFIIGRNPEVAHFVEDNKAVGRAHLEIIKNGAGYAIKDLSSANGSYLNGERLIPNKLYPIKERDVIKLATVEYTFFQG